MTRINVIPVEELTDKHLGAEYRELPRLVKLVLNAIDRGESPNDKRNPSSYRLGPGHVRFFYPRMGYIKSRYIELCNECLRRGRKVSYGDSESLFRDIPIEWMNDWEPTAHSIKINKERIRLRLSESSEAV